MKDTYGFNIDHYGLDVGVLFFIGILVRVVGCLVMWLSDRNKKV